MAPNKAHPGRLVAAASSHYHRVRLEVGMDEGNLRGELALTVTMLVLLLVAVLLIANLIGAIHVIG